MAMAPATTAMEAVAETAARSERNSILQILPGAGLSPRLLQKLKRGEISVQEELDLHGADTREAEQLVRAFLHDARQHDVGCVRIVHGKGLHGAASIASGGQPVLKNLVDRMLRHRADVLAFHSAPPAQGGTGAVLVLLAPRRLRS